MIRLKLALLALFPIAAQAGFHCAQEPCPADGWGGYSAHISYSAAIGVGTELIVQPIARAAGAGPLAQQAIAFGVCLVPGAVREWRSRSEPGNRFSNRDMIANAAGCGLGMGAAALGRWMLTPAPGGVRLAYGVSW